MGNLFRIWLLIIFLGMLSFNVIAKVPQNLQHLPSFKVIQFLMAASNHVKNGNIRETFNYLRLIKEVFEQYNFAEHSELKGNFDNMGHFSSQKKCLRPRDSISDDNDSAGGIISDSYNSQYGSYGVDISFFVSSSSACRWTLKDMEKLFGIKLSNVSNPSDSSGSWMVSYQSDLIDRSKYTQNNHYLFAFSNDPRVKGSFVTYISIGQQTKLK